MQRSRFRHSIRWRRSWGPRSASAAGRRSTSPRSTGSPTSPATINGSTSTPSVPRASDFGGTIVRRPVHARHWGRSGRRSSSSSAASSIALNYGYDKVRFPASMPVGKPLRMRLVGRERPALRCRRARVHEAAFEAEGQDEARVRGRRAAACRPRLAEDGADDAPDPNGTSSGRSSPARAVRIATALWTIRAAVPGYGVLGERAGGGHPHRHLAVDLDGDSVDGARLDTARARPHCAIPPRACARRRRRPTLGGR